MHGEDHDHIPPKFMPTLRITYPPTLMSYSDKDTQLQHILGG